MARPPKPFSFPKNTLAKLRENPHLIGFMIGKEKLTALHSKWIKDCWTASEHIGMQAHRGAYKDIDIQEPVLTTEGYKRHGELIPGDFVFSPSGEPIQVIGISEVFQNKCFAITFSDGHVVKCGEGHLWEVGEYYWDNSDPVWRNRRRRRRFVIKTTKEIYQHSHSPDNRYSVKLNAPLQFCKKTYIISPYLMGVWLGDGHTKAGRITGHKNDFQIIQEIKKEGESISSICYDKRNTNVYIAGIINLTTRLKKVGVFDNKHILEEYQQGSIKQRRDLLQGLMDTDGHCSPRGNAIYITIKKQLAEDVFRLASSLGLAPRIGKYTNYFKALKREYTHYKISFRAYKKDKPFRLLRKLNVCKNVERVFTGKYILSVVPIETIKTNCIKVNSPDGLYLVGKQLTTTHNTTAVTEVGIIWWLLFNPQDRIALIRKPYTEAAKTLSAIQKYFQLETIQVLFKFAHGFYPKFDRLREGSVIFNFKTHITKEGSIDAYSPDGSLTGNHYDKIIMDDVITPKDRFSKAERERTKNGIREILTNIIDPGKQCLMVGTPWHKQDGWELFPSPKKYRPEDTGILSKEDLERKRKQTTPSLFAANYLLEHISSEDTIFPDSTFSPWEYNATGIIAHLDAKYSGTHTGALTFAGRKRNGRIQMTGFVFHETVKEKIGWIVTLYKRYRAGKLYNETNPDKGYTADILAKEGVNVQTYAESENKHNKIVAHLRGEWENIDFAEDCQDEFMTQILDYREGQIPDDCADSAASIVKYGFHSKQSQAVKSLWQM